MSMGGGKRRKTEKTESGWEGVTVSRAWKSDSAQLWDWLVTEGAREAKENFVLRYTDQHVEYRRIRFMRKRELQARLATLGQLTRAVTRERGRKERVRVF